MTFWGFLGGFLTDGKGAPSMSRLLCLLSFGPATWEMFKLNTETALGLYLGAYVVGYVGGKASEAFNRGGGE